MLKMIQNGLILLENVGKSKENNLYYKFILRDKIS